MKEFITGLLTKVNKSLNNKFYNLMKKQGSIYATIDIPVNTAGYSKLNPSYINENNINSYCTISTNSSTGEVTINFKKGIYFISSQLTILPASNTAQFAG